MAIDRINKKNNELAALQRWETNKDFFLQNRERFMNEYPGKYVAVDRGHVLTVGSNLGEVAERVYEQYGNIPVYVDRPDLEEVIDLDLPIS